MNKAPLFATILLALFFASCSKEVLVTGVTLYPSTLQVSADNSGMFTVTITPVNADNQEVIWASSDNAIASVDNNGRVIFHAPGRAVITVTTADGGRTASSTVHAVTPTFDYGVVINHTRWATRNVGSPGTFADRPEDAGMFFQWNRIKGWNTTDTVIWEGWTYDNLYTYWSDENNPCPPGWRLPMLADFQTLLINGSEWGTLNDVTGRFFGTAPNQIFLPASGWRSGNAGSLVAERRAGVFWSETPGTTPSHLTGIPFAWHMLFNEVDNGILVNQVSSIFAFSVRCVAEVKSLVRTVLK